MSLACNPSQKIKGHVLIVDDDEVSRFILGKWLGVWNVSGTFCKDAQSALQAYREHDYCLAIIDYYLPDATGLDLIKEMRLGGGSEPAFALHSTDLELHHLARRHDITYFLPKPFTNGSLYNILRESSCEPLPIKQRAQRTESDTPTAVHSLQIRL